MKILFLCKSNITRSQMAEAFFNKYARNSSAISAALDKPQEKMHRLVVKAMAERGMDMSEILPKVEFLSIPKTQTQTQRVFDISKNKSKKVTGEMIDKADKVILMGRDLSDFLNQIPIEKIEVWDIEDVVASEDDENYEKFVMVRDLIEEKVRGLIHRAQL